MFKAAAIVKDTKQVLLDLDMKGLGDLRSMQNPDSEIEDLLASIIIIGKSFSNPFLTNALMNIVRIYCALSWVDYHRSVQLKCFELRVFT